jgi:hypothetical protein
MSEFLVIWSELEEVASRARAEAKNVALKVCKLIKEKYWKKIEEVSGRYNLRPVLGLEVNSYDILGYRPALYLFSDSPRDRDLANRVYEELGDWVSDARLSIVVLTEEDRKFMKLEFV